MVHPSLALYRQSFRPLTEKDILMLRALFLVICVGWVLTPALAVAEDDHPRPFDQNYDAAEAVAAARHQALAEGKRLLLVFGANWCHDSRGLAHHFEDAELAALLDASYVLTYVDVAWRDANQAVLLSYGVTAIYGTPTVLIIDPSTGDVINRAERNVWTSAASRPIEEARDYFRRYAGTPPAPVGIIETSASYQALIAEIETYENEQGLRLSAAYRDIARWRDLDRSDRPEDFEALSRGVEFWRRDLGREIARLKSQARSGLVRALTERFGDDAITADNMAAFDEDPTRIELVYAPNDADRW